MSHALGSAEGAPLPGAPWAAADPLMSAMSQQPGSQAGCSSTQLLLQSMGLHVC